MKRHLATSEVTTACGRGKVTTSNVRHVDCLLCQDTPAYREALRGHMERAEAEFQAQTPRQVRQMWGGTGNYECRNCGGDLFRERPRSLMYYNFVCEGCGTSIHPPTETGMST